MTVYTRSEAERQLTTVLDRARREGEVLIQGEDGRQYVVKPLPPGGSALDVAGVDLGLTADEIVDAVRESRER